MSFTLDTNILIYAADRSDPGKHARATRLVAHLIDTNGCIPLQCLNEFYSATTRKRLLTASQAEGIVQRFLQSLDAVPAAISDSREAMQFTQKHMLSYFDALLIATAIRSGCAVFLSEDLQDRRAFGSVTVCNPFRLTDSDFEALLT